MRVLLTQLGNWIFYQLCLITWWAKKIITTFRHLINIQKSSLKSKKFQNFLWVHRNFSPPPWSTEIRWNSLPTWWLMTLGHSWVPETACSGCSSIQEVVSLKLTRKIFSKHLFNSSVSALYFQISSWKVYLLWLFAVPFFTKDRSLCKHWTIQQCLLDMVEKIHKMKKRENLYKAFWPAEIVYSKLTWRLTIRRFVHSW